MRVLWVCNIMLPLVAEYLGMEASNKEGWLSGLSETILNRQKENDIELGVCFPAAGELAEFGQEISVSGTDAKLNAFGFYEDVQRAEVYEEKTEKRLREIMDLFKPDMIHCFGTEFPHTLAAVKAFGHRERTLVGIQGLCSIYAKHFRADLPEDVWRRITFRDFVRKDDLRRQHEKFVQRGAYEVEAVQRAGHITGRTNWDKKYTGEWNPDAKYHFMNETLRSNFYEGRWEEGSCQKYSVFLSQGDYPIKGLHYLLQAMPEILREYPETEIYVAGNSIIKSAAQKGIAGIKGKLKLESYGKYILQLLKNTGTLQKVHFLGRLDAVRMKEQYLRSHVYVCSSSIENSSNSVGEAMLLGMPVVCADVGGLADIFAGGEDGIFYQAGDVGKLAEAVKTMFAGGEEVERYRSSARAHAQKNHDPQKNYARLVEIYREIVQ
ncbi:MAG: glycosyltransferase family 4 protein [Lachnospiraceae bacterium]|nr:glycosyltransferase family 4 protein [Lachnospiraceae bacterium]